jgi:hypothetical protein
MNIQILNDNHNNLLLNNKLCIKNTFIDTIKPHYKEILFSFRRINSCDDLLLINNNYNKINKLKNKNKKNKNKNKNKNNDLSILTDDIENNDLSILTDDIKNNDLSILTDDKLLQNIMQDIELYIIIKGVYNEIKPSIDYFKNQNIKLIKSTYTNDRDIKRIISCMNTYTDNNTSTYLLNIRKKIYLHVILNLEELKINKKLDIHINETLILKFKNIERKINRNFISQIIYKWI